LLTTLPGLLLLDEPFSNLDMIHKQILKSVIRDIGEKLNISCIMVSHDPLDTLSWADEILVMKRGRIIQKGTPKEVYSKPVNEYAAALLGKYNLLSKQQSEALTGSPEMEMTGKKILVRPEQFIISKEPVSPFKGTVNHVAFPGGYYELQVSFMDAPLTIITAQSNFVKGDIVYLSVNPEALWYV
jgi:ABC-type Fe3+/spermidine/putrescine transport system ATPase subunit